MSANLGLLGLRQCWLARRRHETDTGAESIAISVISNGSLCDFWKAHNSQLNPAAYGMLCTRIRIIMDTRLLQAHPQNETTLQHLLSHRHRVARHSRRRTSYLCMRRMEPGSLARESRTLCGHGHIRRLVSASEIGRCPCGSDCRWASAEQPSRTVDIEEELPISVTRLAEAGERRDVSFHLESPDLNQNPVRAPGSHYATAVELIRKLAWSRLKRVCGGALSFVVVSSGSVLSGEDAQW